MCCTGLGLLLCDVKRLVLVLVLVLLVQ